jgi:transposase-like protein
MFAAPMSTIALEIEGVARNRRSATRKDLRKESTMAGSKYPEQFRSDAVQTALATQDSLALTAQKLGVHRSTLTRWVAEHFTQTARDSDPSASTTTTMRRSELPIAEQLVRPRAAYHMQFVNREPPLDATPPRTPAPVHHAVESRRVTIELVRVNPSR